MIKAVIFDQDNTLLNFWELRNMSRETAMIAINDVGLSISKKDADKVLTEL